MVKPRIAIVIPYFGNFPNYFDFWLQSALYNPNFNFLIFTDNLKYKTQKNVHFINITFNDFKLLLQNKVEFKIYLKEPYKICDYRPLFGIALKKYLNNYDFWGFGDIDLIYGNLGHFITPQILDNYDKVYELGHLTLLRNNDQCNNLWRIKHHLKSAYRYDEAFKTPYSCHFDETDGLTQIAKLKKIKTYNRVDFADIDRSKFNFFLLGKQNKVVPGVFEWKDGNLNYFSKSLDGKIESNEVAYVHLQKRKMISPILGKSEHEFLIVPNRFIINGKSKIELNNQKITSTYPYYKQNRKNEIKHKIKNHALQQRFYRFFVKNFYRHYLDKK